MMRDAIYKRKVFSNRLATTKTENEQDNTTSTDNASPCPYCDRKFQRKAVLATHLASCQLKALYPDKKLTVQGNTTTNMKGYNKRQLSKEHVATTQTNVPFNSVTATTKIKQEAQSNIATDITIDINTTRIPKSSSAKELLHNVVNKQKNKQKINAKFLPCLCKICNKHFNALCNLRRHISMFHYRTRKFGCKLCDYRAYRKYDVINHLGHVHKIMGEKETISVEYIETYEEQNSRDGVDNDVVLITDEKPKKDDIKQNIKDLEPQEHDKYKNKFNKSMLISTQLQKTKRERQNLKRSISQQLFSKNDINLSHYQKRPRRNCIKTVKKDFVYDLSSILKKDNANDSEWKIAGRSNFKRRNTMAMINTINVELNADSTIFETKNQRQIRCIPLIDSSVESVKGAAQKIALSLINQGRAASATVPQLPTERPQVRVRHASIYKADFSTIPVFETTALEEARLKAKLLDDSFLENLSTSTTNEFKIKPRLALPQSTINSLLQKVDLTLQNQLKIKSIGVESKNCTPHDLSYEDNNSSSNEQAVLIKQEHCMDILPHSDVVENQEIVYAHCESDSINIADDGKAYSKLVCLPQKPRKCIKLMECLLENKTQNRESLLRFALEN